MSAPHRKALSAQSQPSADREAAERFLKGSRRQESWGSWLSIAAVLLALGALLVWLLRRRTGAAARDATPGPRAAAPTLTFREVAYHAYPESDGCVGWSAKLGPNPEVAVEQAALARTAFAALPDSMRDAAAKLIATHGAWFEERAMSAAELARELRVTDVRVPADCKDVTVWARHSVFSGHVVEISLTRNGAVTYVGLAG